MDDKELNREIIMEALRHCFGMYWVDADSGCDQCPLYEDHYCVDTLYSVIGEKLDFCERFEKAMGTCTLRPITEDDIISTYKKQPPRRL